MKDLQKTHLWYLVIFVAFSISVTGCQQNSITCKATTNPFPTHDPSGHCLTNQNVNIGQVCHFVGEVKRGQSFQQSLPEGLVFCLTPDSFWQENGGWRINISDEIGEVCDDNFAGIVTPPFRGGYNDTFVQGWQFRNENNTGESDVVSNWLTRSFSFVFSQNDHDAIFNDAFNLPNDENINVNEIPTSRGELTIVNLELGNLIPHETAWIESMKFEVKIYLPPD